MGKTHTILFININAFYHWCSKCGGGGWTTTHCSSDHRDLSSGSNSNTPGKADSNHRGIVVGGKTRFQKKSETNLHAYSSWAKWNDEFDDDDIEKEWEDGL